MNLLEVLRKTGPSSGKVTKTATATLTAQEAIQNLVVSCTHATVAITLTLPVAGAGLKDEMLLILNGGAAAVTVTVAAGFAAAGDSADTVVMSVGGFCIVYCTGTAWFVMASTLPS